MLIDSMLSNTNCIQEIAMWVAQVLTGDAIATLLLTCHQHLQRAKHPRHALQALAPLKALLSLLYEEACVPSTFRYIINILLQQLNTR
jgi:hypothetical protein